MKPSLRLFMFSLRLCIFPLLLGATLAHADPQRVKSFDDTTVEIKRAGGFEEVSTSEFPAPPLDVLALDEKNNLAQLKLKSGEKVWVDRNYLIMERSNLAKSGCGVREIARDESKLYGVRGIGEGCK